MPLSKGESSSVRKETVRTQLYTLPILLLLIDYSTGGRAETIHHNFTGIALCLLIRRGVLVTTSVPLVVIFVCRTRLLLRHLLL